MGGPSPWLDTGDRLPGLRWGTFSVDSTVWGCGERIRSMECRDMDKLRDLYYGRLVDAELERHVTDCPSCRADWKLLYCLPLLEGHEIEVPEAWVQGVLARWAEKERAEGPTRAR
jgi:hypothetical protein